MVEYEAVVDTAARLYFTKSIRGLPDPSEEHGSAGAVTDCVGRERENLVEDLDRLMECPSIFGKHTRLVAQAH